MIKARPVVADVFCDLPVVDERLILPEVDIEFLHGQRFRTGRSLCSIWMTSLSFERVQDRRLILDSAIEVALVSGPCGTRPILRFVSERVPKESDRRAVRHPC